MSRSTRVRAGWSRTPLPISPDMVVLDLGSGAFPNARADILCDRELIDDTHRAGMAAVVDRPMMRADVCALPVRDRGVHFVIASHIAEHVEEPELFCRELSRAAYAGYIETPSPLADFLLHEDYHLWRVSVRRGVLRFSAKRPRNSLTIAATDVVYRIFYAGQPSCSRAPCSLPKGRLGTLARSALLVLGAGLNRVGVMHTRLIFSPTAPLRWEVDRARLRRPPAKGPVAAP